MFGDVYGFSKLSDAEIRRFVEHVLATIGRTLSRFGRTLEYRNTWGDAVYAVFTSGEDAAACALELQEAMAMLDLRAAGLPEHLALRLGLHLGPVIPTFDPVTGTSAFMGSHVSRTARIEPVTPPGAVYVTDHVAASLVLHRSPYACDYVGHVPAAKDYGRLRMYRLRRRS
jgi:class 3 adenylate cyclase